METATDMLTITDDEAVTLSVFVPGPWRAPLPTVDETSRESLVQAAQRGRRSLVVRDLAASDGSPIGLAAEVARRLSAGLRAFFLLADADGNWLPRGATVYLYGPALDAIEVTHTVADAGVHYFQLDPVPGQWHALTLLAESVYSDGFAARPEGSDAPRPVAALLHVVRPDGIRLVRITRGSVTTGRGPVPARFPSVAEAVSWLLA
jgi:hypothetical protein